MNNLKSLVIQKSKQEKKTRAVRNELKEYDEEKQDADEGVSETYKPLIDVQKSVKKSIDEKQDELIEQLQENQKAITSGLEDVIIYNQLPETSVQNTKLPTDYKPEMMDESPPEYKSDLDKGFNPADIQTLVKYKLYPPSDVLKGVRNKILDFNDYNNNLGKITKKLGSEKGGLSKSKKMRDSNKEEINKLTNEIKSLQKYRQRISIIPEGLDTLGSGIYTQKKRTAYKVNPQNGTYGNLIVDLPKLFGQFKMIAYKDGKKVYDKQADFDTIDLLTKRFNSKKKYSDLSRMIFNELNTLSEIPIHRTSNKYKKLGSGVVYYNSPNDLLDRTELLGGSLLAGNDGVKNEFTQIAHTLNKIGVIDNNQLNDLLREYVI